MQDITGGWTREDVAKAQRDLVIQELTIPEQVGPFAAFMWAMNVIGLMDGTLLDAGCGCGHYGVLCERLYPRIRYHGTDISEHMIHEATQLAPLGRFSVCRFEDNDFSKFDIVLVGQVIETMDDPPAMLKLLLDNARGYIILNRLRLTEKVSCPIIEGTYCGQIGHTWQWNINDITRLIGKDRNVMRRDWDNQVTLVVGKAQNG